MISESGPLEVFYAVYGPYAISLPQGHLLVPEGVVSRVLKPPSPPLLQPNSAIWKVYSTESFYDTFERDYMNREVCAYFFFCLGKHLILAGQKSQGLRNLRWAAGVGYDDDLIHSEMAVFLTDHGFLDEARAALEKSLLHHEDLSGVHNNWGYYYHKAGDYPKAVEAFRKAVELRPDRFGFYNNLGFALLKVGKKEEASLAFGRSLEIHRNQPEITRVLQETTDR